MPHHLTKDWSHQVQRMVPFGLDHTKPHPFTDMLRIAWKNRDNVGYGWKVLSRGVRDGCALERCQVP